MNKHLKQLIDLSKLDKAVDDFLPEENRINSALNALFDEQKKAAEATEELELQISENRLKIAKNETQLAELSTKLGTHGKRSADIKTEKEMKAYSLEEDIAREQIGYHNDEIARLQKIEDAKKEEIAAKKARIEEIESQVGDAKQANTDALAELDQRRSTYIAQKDELSAEIPPKILNFYLKIRRWAGNRAVVPVKRQACYGCFMKIGDKIYGDVISSSEIVTCPNCGCILYIDENEIAQIPAQLSAQKTAEIIQEGTDEAA